MKTLQHTFPILGVLLMQGLALANRQVYLDVSSATMIVVAGDSQGSGVLVDADRRLAVTAWHVVDTPEVASGEPVQIVLPFFDAFGEIILDDSFYEKHHAELAAYGYISTARVIAFDSNKDLAMLRLDAVPSGKRAVSLASTSMTAGDVLHIVGHPAERPHWNYSVGIVDQVEESPKLNWWLGFDAKSVWFFGNVWYGNSGGPVVNQNGELVGIVSSKTDIQHLAIHVDEVAELMASMGPEGLELAGK